MFLTYLGVGVHGGQEDENNKDGGTGISARVCHTVWAWRELEIIYRNSILTIGKKNWTRSKYRQAKTMLDDSSNENPDQEYKGY
ncbi:hypothetical protein P5V15_015932 [Pogonomyrmex californicus]